MNKAFLNELNINLHDVAISKSGKTLKRNELERESYEIASIL